ncbi:hypothetical protein [Okeania sp. SIO1I7]|uniref:hypothetical protein n=1 Tax=Okeania sp. SIO1I7 TaxID=2607772 RepID=UPI0013F8C563|nr:hypothetical protein [Okeania sp. SIO1I7]NET29980.1 hypothetical protein [Okeania sp. SIO1I7]
MSTEHDYQQLYEQNKEAIAILETILYSLYQTIIKIKSQLLEQALNQGKTHANN